MRLLYCETCQDVVKLIKSDDDRHCDCGRSFGRLDENSKIVAGGPHRIFGVKPNQFNRALTTQPDGGQSASFFTYILPKKELTDGL